MHQAERDPRQKVVAQIRTDALPHGNQHDQQRHAFEQLQLAQIRIAGKQAGLRISQAVDEIFEDVGKHRLGRCEDQKANDTQNEQAGVRTHVSQKAEVDRQR